jgi:hypothetical protein
MTADSKVTLQINLAPSDLRLSTHVLPHQLRQWAGQVDEVLLTLNSQPTRNEVSADWDEKLQKMRMLINEYCAKYSNIYLREVDYSPETVKQVSSMFFGGKSAPIKDHRGRPIYPYFFGLYAARNNYVFHLDSDMMFGGGSPTWMAEATQLLAERTDVLVCNPFAGPPTSNGQLKPENIDGKFGNLKFKSPELEPYTSLAFRFYHLSGRVFLLDKQRFASSIKELHPKPPAFHYVIKAWLDKNPPYELAEITFSRAMLKHSMFRVDLLGKEPGMWSLHPPYRSELFYQKLPEIIQRIESGDIPEAQRGDYDINDSLVDWTDVRLALQQKYWWRRLKYRLSN